MTSNEILFLQSDVRNLKRKLESQQEQIGFLLTLVREAKIHEPNCTKGQEVPLSQMHYGVKYLSCNCWLALPTPF